MERGAYRRRRRDRRAPTHPSRQRLLGTGGHPTPPGWPPSPPGQGGGTWSPWTGERRGRRRRRGWDVVESRVGRHRDDRCRRREPPSRSQHRRRYPRRDGHRPRRPHPAEIRSAPHVRPEAVTFASGDGLEIPAFLFRPLAADRGRVPAVVYPHGGPDRRLRGRMGRVHAQYFIDKGYAWLAVNFRGSTTYGRDFERANHGDWGVGDTADCLAAHDYLASLDWVDPARYRDLRRQLRLIPGAAQPGRRPAAPVRMRGGEVRRQRHPQFVGIGRQHRG